jgi:hypothetical protein
LLGNGDGTFQPAQTFDAGIYLQSIALGDFNGDGNLDVAVADVGSVRVLLGNGDGTLKTSSVSYVAGGNPTSLAVGRFDGDSELDLAVANFSSNDVSILRNDGPWTDRPGSGASGGSRGAGWLPLLAPRDPASAEAPLATAVFHEPHSPALAVPAAGPAQAPPALEIAARGNLAILASAPGDDESGHPIPAPPWTPAPQAILDLAFLEVPANVIDGALMDDRSLPLL